MIYLFYALSPALIPLIFASIFGMTVSVLWWMNIDSYQLLIKVKYAKVLEYLETKLPEQPFHKEFVETKNMQKDKKIIFADIQKWFAGFSLFSFTVIFIFLLIWGITQENPVWF